MLFDPCHHLLQGGEIGVPVFQQRIDAGDRTQWAWARRDIKDIVAEHDGGERFSAILRKRAEFEGSAVHGLISSDKKKRSMGWTVDRNGLRSSDKIRMSRARSAAFGGFTLDILILSEA